MKVGAAEPDLQRSAWAGLKIRVKLPAPWMTVGLAAVPPEPLAYSAQALQLRSRSGAEWLSISQPNTSPRLPCAASDCRRRARESIGAVPDGGRRAQDGCWNPV